MSRLGLIARTVPRLGLRNVARVAVYKLYLKAGWRPQPLSAGCPTGPVFDLNQTERVSNWTTNPTELTVFGWNKLRFVAPPDWHAPCLGYDAPLNWDQDWVDALAEASDRDVKPYWELSRFYWLPQFALNARNGDHAAAERIERWMHDWIARNPPFRGINWSCGQEAGIRLMNLALGALILDAWRTPSPVLKWLVETHARRVLPTLPYALGQDNNHGSAEACALYIAGSWGRQWSMPEAEHCAKTGLRWLNERALRLIQPDGSPCQYSTTYHRANLETLCMAGLWSARTGAESLSSDSIARVVDGARWLHAIVDPLTGDAPNIGANDGSWLFSLLEAGYRDFRPTIAMVAALFDDSNPWPDYTDPRMLALDVVAGASTWPSPDTRISDSGGFQILRQKEALVLMRYPRFHFRPSHCDSLHVDLWVEGENLLRDGGTYSYNTEPKWIHYFSGSESHNTVQFDNRDQMPRLSRFLFGDWLKTIQYELKREGEHTVASGAAYRDHQGAFHGRRISLTADSLQVQDRVEGFGRKAVLRWRLKPGDWRVDGQCARSGDHILIVQADVPLVRFELTTGFESRYYLQKSTLPVLEVEVDRPATLLSEYRWTP